MTAIRIYPRTTSTFLLLSGFAALTYQIVWLRLLSLSIGMTSAAIGAVLAAVFLGMALGAWLTNLLPQRWQGRLLSFAIAEAVVGLSALLLLPVLLNLDHLMALVPDLSSQLWFRFSAAALLLSIPAAGLGATYPLVVSLYARGQAVTGNHLGHLYAMQTLGAAAGALITIFVLIPWQGLDGAVYLAVSINWVIALSAAILSKSQRPDIRMDRASKPDTVVYSRLGLLVLVVTGMCSIAACIGWIKYLTIYTEATFHGVALILAVILSGIATGAWLARVAILKFSSVQLWLAIGLVALGMAMLFGRTGLMLAPELEQFLIELGIGDISVARYATILLILFPPALLIGAIFPLSLLYYSGDTILTGNRVGKGYAVHILSGVAGVTMAWLWLNHGHGTDQLLLVAALIIAATSLLFVTAIPKTGVRVILSLLALTTTVIALVFPGINYQHLVNHIDKQHRGGFYVRSTAEPKFLFLKEADRGVISLMDYSGTVMLKNNALVESQLPLKRARSEIFLGLLPTLFKPGAGNALIIGNGAGTTTRMLAAAGVKSIKVIEAEPAAVEAMAMLEDGANLLFDNRVTIKHKDARVALLLDSVRYDIIVSRSSHPWQLGAGALSSREFYRIAHNRLEKGGIFAQWINLHRMDATMLRAVLRTFYSEFPRGVVFNNNLATEVVLFGSDEGLELEHHHVAKRLDSPELRPFTQALAIGDPDDLIEKYFLFTRDVAITIAGDSPIITDLNLFSEIRPAWLREHPVKEEDPRVLIEPYTR